MGKKKTAKFFVSSPVWGHAPNECEQSSLMKFESYAHNYFESAAALALLANDDRLKTNTYGFPIAFLYRQYVELMLKEIIDLLRRIERQEFGFPTNHDLANLWIEARQLIKSHYSCQANPEPCGINLVEDCVEEFHANDSKSMAFRYPCDRKGKLHKLPPFDIPNLQALMDEVRRYLDTVYGDLYGKWQSLT